MTARDLYEKGKAELVAEGIADAANDASLLLEYICGIRRMDLLLRPGEEVSIQKEQEFLSCIEKRKAHIPLQHITGLQGFMGYEFIVSEDVLVPRQDTEILVEEAISKVRPNGRVLDLCTGSGCILLSMAMKRRDITGVGSDLSSAALEIAKRNQEKLSEEDASLRKRTDFFKSDLFERIEGTFDAILSNPPYISPEVIETLEPEVKDHDPRMALDGGKDGLEFYEKILVKAKEYLNPGGILLFEIGSDQGESVPALMEQAGFIEITVKKDYAGLDRVVMGKLEAFHKE